MSVISNGFLLPRAIQAMGVTTTLAGITTRQLLLGISGDQILGINHGFLHPRRPVNPTSEDNEEGLIPYHASLQLNPKDVISYYKHVLEV